MKRFLFYITLFLTFLLTFTGYALADNIPVKVTGLTYDTSSSIVSINTQNSNGSSEITPVQKVVPLSNPNRVYFDIENAVLAGEKQQIVFEKSNIKEVRLAQFSTNPFVVRAVITFEEDFDTSKIKLVNSGGSVILVGNTPKISNDYFNVIYDENNTIQPYSHISASSQFVQKIAIPIDNPQSASS